MTSDVFILADTLYQCWYNGLASACGIRRLPSLYEAFLQCLDAADLAADPCDAADLIAAVAAFIAAVVSRAAGAARNAADLMSVAAWVTWTSLVLLPFRRSSSSLTVFA